MLQAVSPLHEPWQLRWKGASHGRPRGWAIAPGNRALKSSADASGIAELMSDCLRSVAASGDRDAFEQFAEMVRSHEAVSDNDAWCGPTLYDLLLRHGPQPVKRGRLERPGQASLR